MDSRDRRINELEARIEQLMLVVEAQAVWITVLEARLKADSTNSSKPPSSDVLSKRPAWPRERGKRSPGKQPGCDGRHLVQVADPGAVVVHRPSSCGACGEGLPRRVLDGGAVIDVRRGAGALGKSDRRNTHVAGIDGHEESDLDREAGKLGQVEGRSPSAPSNVCIGGERLLQGEVCAVLRATQTQPWIAAEVVASVAPATRL